MLCVGESGCGKTPAFNVGSLKPIDEGVEQSHPGKVLLIDECTETGIFQTCLNSGDDLTLIISRDEAYDFFDQVVKNIFV